MTLSHAARRVWLPVVLILTAAGLASTQLDTALWIDEYLSIYDIGGMDESPLTLAGVWARVGERNPYHAPGFFLMLRVWAALMGWQPFVLRLLAFYAGVLALAGAYRLGKDTVSPAVGAYGLVILGASPFFQHYLHDLRMYTLMALFGVLALWGYLRLLGRMYHGGAWLWGGLALGFIGLAYIHYFAWLMLAAVGVYHLLFAPKRRGWWGVVGLMALAALLFSPWVRVLLAGIQNTMLDESVQERALTTPEALAALAHGSSAGSYALLALTAGLALLALGMPGQAGERRGAWRLAFFALVPLALLLGANEALQLMHARRIRYMIVFWVPLALLLAVGVNAAGRWRPVLGVALAAAWGVTGVVSIARDGTLLEHDGAEAKLPMHRIARELRAHAQPGDFLYVFPPDEQESWRYEFVADYYFNGLGDGYTIVNVKPTNGDPQDPGKLFESVARRQRVWVAHMPDFPTHAAFVALLGDAYHACQTYHRAGAVLALYTHDALCCPSLTADRTALAFAGGVTLAAHNPLPASVTDNGLSLLLGWRIADTTPDGTYSVGLYALDAAGEVRAQADTALPLADDACQRVTLDVGDLPPGDYTLCMAVYDWQSGERLPAGDTTCPALGTFATAQ